MVGMVAWRWAGGGAVGTIWKLTASDLRGVVSIGAQRGGSVPVSGRRAVGTGR